MLRDKLYTIPVCVLKVTVIQHLRTIFIRKSCDLNVVNSANLALKVNGSDKYFYPQNVSAVGFKIWHHAPWIIFHTAAHFDN